MDNAWHLREGQAMHQTRQDEAALQRDATTSRLLTVFKYYHGEFNSAYN